MPVLKTNTVTVTNTKPDGTTITTTTTTTTTEDASRTELEHLAPIVVRSDPPIRVDAEEMDQPQQELVVTSATGSLATSRYAMLCAAPPSQVGLTANELDPGLLGKRFTSKDGDVTAESLKGKYIALNFSAAWCSYGINMNPDVLKTYDAIKERIPNFEIIYVASPHDNEAGFNELYGLMPWLALPFDARDERAKLYELFGFTNIGMVILDPNFKIMNEHGFGELLRDPKGLNFPWERPPMRRIVRTREVTAPVAVDSKEEAEPNTTQESTWTDPDFKPNQQSLCNGDFSKNPAWADFVWRRLADFYPDAGKVGKSIFRSGVDENDIFQGMLGDCYFLCALSVLAEQPGRIDKCFITKKINQAGRYEVKFFKMGLPVTVVVDDYFPCTSATGGPAFAKSKHQEPWVMLFEKAWAKLHGSYLQIERGRVGPVLCDLTGAPHEDFRWRRTGLGLGTCNLDDTWQQLRAADMAGLPMAASMPHVGGMGKQEGLVEGHAYAIVGTKLLASGTIKLVELRNPWGTGDEWTGKYSDNSDAWTTALQVEADFDPKTKMDGRFHMELQDFVHYMNEMCVLDLQADWSRAVSQFKAGTSGKAVAGILKVNRQTQAVISIHQRDKRQLESDDDLGCTRFEVFRVNGGASDLVFCGRSKDRDASVTADLASGDYRVVIWGTFPGDEARDCSLSVYSEHPIQLGTIGSFDDLVDAQLSKAHAEYTLRNGKVSKSVPNKITTAGIVVKSLSHTEGFDWACQNNSDRTCSMQLNWNTTLVYCGSGPPDEIIMVKPGETKASRIRKNMADPSTQGIRYGFNPRFNLISPPMDSNTFPKLETQTRDSPTSARTCFGNDITVKKLQPDGFDFENSWLLSNNTKEGSTPYGPLKFTVSLDFRFSDNIAIVHDLETGAGIEPIDRTPPANEPVGRVDFVLTPGNTRHLVFDTIKKNGEAHRFWCGSQRFGAQQA